MQSNKLKIGVLMGGKTPEHEISLISGKEVTRALEKKGHEVLPVVISRDGGTWKLTSPNELYSLPDLLSLKGTKRELVTTNFYELSGPKEMSNKKVDVIFIGMHGPYGEDGTVQGMLELTGIPYVGSGVLASALGMNKMMFRKFLDALNIKYPRFTVVNKNTSINIKGIKRNLGKLPYFVKPNSQGSSVGSSIARTENDLRTAIMSAFEYDEIVLLDEYIRGKEVTCAVIGRGDKLEALPLVEILPEKEFFDFESKYTSKKTIEIVPARLSQKLTKEVQEISKKIFREIGAKGMARIDFILKDGRTPFVLEINTIPGLTPMSLMPKAAKAAGYSYEDFIDKIVRLSL